MAAPIINPVAIVLFLISIRFLLSTHFLHVYLSAPTPINAKAASSNGSGFPLCNQFMARLWCFCQRLERIGGQNNRLHDQAWYHRNSG
jgi:hypothetical protein